MTSVAVDFELGFACCNCFIYIYIFIYILVCGGNFHRNQWRYSITSSEALADHATRAIDGLLSHKGEPGESGEFADRSHLSQALLLLSRVPHTSKNEKDSFG